VVAARLVLLVGQILLAVLPAFGVWVGGVGAGSVLYRGNAATRVTDCGVMPGMRAYVRRAHCAHSVHDGTPPTHTPTGHSLATAAGRVGAAAAFPVRPTPASGCYPVSGTSALQELRGAVVRVGFVHTLGAFVDFFGQRVWRSTTCDTAASAPTSASATVPPTKRRTTRQPQHRTPTTCRGALRRALLPPTITLTHRDSSRRSTTSPALPRRTTSTALP
jgi:hypothetical protein